jgi:hypothetical protein
MTNLAAQNKNMSAIFAVKFEPVPAGYYTAMNGLISMGGLPDSSWYIGDIKWIPIINTTAAAVSLLVTLLLKI